MFNHLANACGGVLRPELVTCVGNTLESFPRPVRDEYRAYMNLANNVIVPSEPEPPKADICWIL